MITYQKVYTDHVHSSTLMSQFTQLWKNHLMCDAELIVGDTVIKVSICNKFDFVDGV